MKLCRRSTLWGTIKTPSIIIKVKSSVSVIIASRGYNLPAFMTVTVYPAPMDTQTEILQHVGPYSIPGRLLFWFVNLCSMLHSMFRLSAERSLSVFTRQGEDFLRCLTPLYPAGLRPVWSTYPLVTLWCKLGTTEARKGNRPEIQRCSLEKFRD